MPRQENQRRSQPFKLLNNFKKPSADIQNKVRIYAWRLVVIVMLGVAGCSRIPENTNQQETLPANTNESTEAFSTPESSPIPPLPIIDLNETDIIQGFPDTHSFLMESMQKMDWVSGKSVELSALIFSPSNEPPEVVILATIDGFPHIALRRQQGEDDQIQTQIEMSPLFVSQDEQGNVLYFTALEDEQGNPFANPFLKEVTNSDGTQESWGYLTNGSIVKSPTDLSNPFTTHGKLASAIPTQNLTSIPTFDETLNTYTATNLEGNPVSWSGQEWQRLLPALPDWAQEYITFHQGQLETINGIDYYITQKTVQVGEETRQVAVKMMEYDQKAQEWIPCYDTVQELLDTRQLGSLHELNNITAPEEAVWIVRENWPESKEDLQKLEVMFHEFGVQIETEAGLEMWPKSFIDDPPEILLIDMFCAAGCRYNITIDNTKVDPPQSWITMRRGDKQQVIIGSMFYEQPGLIWFGLDQAGFAFQDERIHQKNRTSFDDAIATLINHNDEYSIISFVLGIADFLSATPESAAAWTDVLDYYAQLPVSEQDFQYDAKSSWSRFGRENPAWIESMSGKINWLSSGMYAIEKE